MVSQNRSSSSQINFASFKATSNKFLGSTIEILLFILCTAHCRLIAVGLDLTNSSALFLMNSRS